MMEKLKQNLRIWNIRTDIRKKGIQDMSCTKMNKVKIVSENIQPQSKSCLHIVCDNCNNWLMDFMNDRNADLSSYIKGVFIRILILSNLVTYTVVKVGWI